MYTDLNQFILEELGRYNRPTYDYVDTGDGGFNGTGGRLVLNSSRGGVNGTGIFSDPGGGLVSEILSPSKQSVLGELVKAGIIGAGNDHYNDGFKDIVENGKVTGSINSDLIDDAIKNLPTPDLSGQRPPTQTGPSVGDQVDGPIVGTGSGGVPNAPTRTTRDNEYDPFGILDALLKGGNIISSNGGGVVSQVPTGADNEGFGLDDILSTIFGSGTQATNTNQNSNILQDLIGAVTGGSAENALSNVIDFGISDYVADKQLESVDKSLDFYRSIFDDQLDRLEPFRLAGVEALPNLSAATTSNPRPRNLDGVPLPEAGRRPVTLGDPSTVDVNTFDPYDVNDPVLQSIIQSGANAIDASQVAKGKLNSGETYEKLQELGQTAALGRAGQIQAIEATRDGLDLASQNQNFNQTTTNAGFTHQLNEDDLIRSLVIGDTDFNRKITANNFDLSFDKHKFGKLFDTTRIGQNSAAQQGAGSASLGITGADLIGQEGDIRTARTAGFANALADFF